MFEKYLNDTDLVVQCYNQNVKPSERCFATTSGQYSAQMQRLELHLTLVQGIRLEGNSSQAQSAFNRAIDEAVRTRSSVTLLITDQATYDDYLSSGMRNPLERYNSDRSTGEYYGSYSYQHNDTLQYIILTLNFD